MQRKWYFRSLFILVILTGLILEQIVQPNQQIVVEFGGDTASIASTQKTITTLTNELEALGAQRIKVQHGENGTLTISYFTTIDLQVIKGMLYTKKELLNEFASCSSFPVNQTPPFETTSVYTFDVHEIQKQSDIAPDLNGFMSAFEGKTHRYYLVKVYDAFMSNQTPQQNKNTEISFLAQRAVSITLTESTCKIPQVRAGPIA